MTKSEIRRQIKNLRLMLSDMEKESAAAEVFDRLEKTAAFLKKWGARKKFFLPRVNGVNLEILPYDESRLELGAFHIEEPTGGELTDPDTLDLIVVPAVASKIGVGYDFQLLDSIPTEPHDVAMDMVITQGETIIIRM